MKRIAILGSTGSIGVQTLEVIREIEGFEVVALSANSNTELLLKQIEEFRPKYVTIMDEQKALDLKKHANRFGTEVHVGLEGLEALASMPEVDIVINSLIGNIGLLPTVSAIKSGKKVCLANKETLVTAGEIIMPLTKEHDTAIIPIDSEHSAILQCLQGNDYKDIERLILTASGGPFREKTKDDINQVSVDDAMKHPTYQMGAKITIDSSTLMNKGLEVIEAKWLFDIPLEKIDIVVHPQSIIHSMVEYKDGSILAQMGNPDMRLPIQYALSYPQRVQNSYNRLDILNMKDLTFEKPDLDKFQCLKLCLDAAKTCGTMPTVMNAANEIAVSNFLAKKITFKEISELIERTMLAYTVKYNIVLDDIIEADNWAREKAKSIIASKLK